VTYPHVNSNATEFDFSWFCYIHRKWPLKWCVCAFTLSPASIGGGGRQRQPYGGWCRQRVYRRAKGKGVAVLDHKPTKVLRLSTSNLVASRKPETQSLHQKLAAG